MRIVRILLVLVLCILSLQNYGNLPEELVNYIFFILLSSAALLYYSSDFKNKFAAIAFFIIAVLLLTAVPHQYKLLFLSISIYMVGRFSHVNVRTYAEIRSLYFSSFILLLFSWLYQNSASVWIAVQTISYSISSVVSMCSGSAVGRKGVAYSGLFTFAVFLSYLASLFINSDKRNRVAFCLLLVSLPVSLLLYAVLSWLLLHSSVSSQPELFYAALHYDFSFIFFIPSTLIAIKKLPPKTFEREDSRIKINKRDAAAIGLFFTAFFLMTFHITVPGEKGTVYIYKKGSFNWDLPTYEKFGALNGGMFGLLPEFLSDAGYSVIRDTALSTNALRPAQVLVLINASNNFSPQEKQCIWDFVNNGGSLLVLGDHTGNEVIRNPYNDLLAPFHIQYNFDSGIPFVTHWDRGLEFRPHYITQRIASNFDAHIGIGATLTITHASNPIIVGTFGYSDAGNYQNPGNGYLGDMAYSTDETAGDLVLAAEQSYGKGKILVFGDTSPFQNSEISEDYKFLMDTFDYLVHPTYAANVPLFLILMLFIASLFIALYRQQNTIAMLFILSLCGYAAIELNGLLNRHRDALDIHANIVSIDKSHMERFNDDQWEANGLGGTILCCMRNGYMPILLDRFDEQRIMKSKVLLLVAPAQPLTQREIEILHRFIEQGGFVMLSSGWEESASVKPLLESFQTAVVNIPLGRLESYQNSAMLTLPNAWALQSTDGHAELLSQSSGYPVILSRKIQKGGLFVIGDSKFFLNDNIEAIYSYTINNILFIRSLLNKTNN